VDAAALRARHGIASTETVLVSVGRLEANKGFHLLAQALGRLAAIAGWRWVLVGDGPYRSTIESAVAASGLGDRVVFAGRVTEADLHAWYEAAALFVHPTLYEGSSLVTLEAMAHRRAVVATRAGGVPDKVEPGKSGWLVDPGDVAQLAQALEEALSDCGRLAAMGREGRAIVEARFSWSSVVDTLLGVFSELLARRA
jgi:glycosyltransferase involved in cell wall biosynthesis